MSAPLSGAPSNSSKARLLDPHDDRFDGHLIGSETVTAKTDLQTVEGIKPRRKEADGKIVWVNGIMSDVAMQKGDMQKAADLFGKEVVGVHNSTEGMGRDLAQCLKDKTGQGVNPATETLRTVIENHLNCDSSTEPLHIVGHSQGALITSNALKATREQLMGQGKSDDEIDELLQKIQVTTLAGAGARFPDGPRYQHVINRADPVPWLAGATGLPGTSPGQDAQQHFFTAIRSPGSPELPSWRHPVQKMARATDNSVHGAANVYLDHAGRGWTLMD